MAKKVRTYGLKDVIDLLNLYIDMVKKHFKDRLISIAVFGSIVRGEAGSNSDIDMLIVIKNLPQDVGKRVRTFTEIKFKLKSFKEYWQKYREGKPRLISEIILTPEEVVKHPPILLDISYEGIILYDKNRFLEKELEKIRERLKKLGARRIKGKKGWYWILKPKIRPGEVIKI